MWEYIENRSAGTCSLLKRQIFAPTAAEDLCYASHRKHMHSNYGGFGVGDTQPILWIEHEPTKQDLPKLFFFTTRTCLHLGLMRLVPSHFAFAGSGETGISHDADF